MKVPFLCRVGLHRWRRARRVNGFKTRSCANCRAKQEEHFPGGGWRVVTPVKRVRKPKSLHLVTVLEEQNLDQLRELGPL